MPPPVPSAAPAHVPVDVHPRSAHESVPAAGAYTVAPARQWASKVSRTRRDAVIN